MNQFLKKGLVLATAALSIGYQAKADKGMWLLNELTRENVAQMKELGFRLPIDSLYNLDKPSVPPTALAARPLPGNLQVEPGEGGERIAASNAARYAPYVQAFTALDPAATATAYKRFYPLIQQAYVDLGRPDGYFNDRLVAVIDHLLDTPELAQSPVVQRDERGRYRFVDPTLQSRSIGQKALLRMDAAQARAVKQQLRAIRSAITR